MAAVRMNAVFPAGAEVKLVHRQSSDMHVSGDVIATGTVDERSVLFIEGVKVGGYWAVCGEQSVQVRAKDGRQGARERPGARGEGFCPGGADRAATGP